MNQTKLISKTFEKSLFQKAPNILKTYQSYLEFLDDIEIKD